MRESWNNAVERSTANIVRGALKLEAGRSDGKKPIADLSFELAGITYVKPAPSMYGSSSFFGGRRPRMPFKVSRDLGPLCIIYAGISRGEWDDFRNHGLLSATHVSYDDWAKAEAAARGREAKLPLLVVPISYSGWTAWLGSADDANGSSVHEYASRAFHDKAEDIYMKAFEFGVDQVLPSRFLRLVTREIGQDAGFDVPSLYEVSLFGTPEESVQDVWIERRLDLNAGRVQASAQAVMRGVEFLCWKRDATYCLA